MLCLAVVVLLLVVGASASAKDSSGKRPAGVPPSAEKVDPSDLKVVTITKIKKPTVCAQLKPNRWTAGVRYPGNWFASYIYLQRWLKSRIGAAKKTGKSTAALEKKIGRAHV